MTIKIVTDGNKYAIKKKSFWETDKYFDLNNPGFWWTSNEEWFADCWSDKKTAEMWFNRLNAK